MQAGDHILVGDNVYRPPCNFCNGVLARNGVETTYFDPLIGTAIAKLFKPNTRAVMRENVEDLKARSGQRCLDAVPSAPSRGSTAT